MAPQAVPHAHGHVLGDDIQGLNLAMAGLAGDACAHVRTVVEVDVVGKGVDAFPLERAAGLVDRRQHLYGRALRLRDPVTVHARLDGRHFGVP
jgi:hypothetical protein